MIYDNFRRLDTGEIIHTNNLWSHGGSKGNIDNLPEIEFINEEDTND